MEVLFRGKCGITGDWIFGDLVQAPGRKGIIPTDSETGLWVRAEPETVGMFTGKYDLKRNRAFNGDIILDQNGYKWEISWSIGRSAFVAQAVHFSGIKTTALSELEIALVIGNIYDNDETYNFNFNPNFLGLEGLENKKL